MPTPECRCLLPTLQELVRQELVLLDQLDQIRDLRGGTVSIGTFTSVSCHWLPRRLKAFGQLYPQIRFQLKLGDVAHIDQWLREGTVDLGLMIDPETEDLTFLPLLEDCYSVILPREHPLAGAEELSLEQLREECFILLEPEDNAPVEPQLRQAGVRVGYRVKDDYTILAMVESGLGVSVLPHLLLQRTSYRVHAARLMPPGGPAHGHPPAQGGICLPGSPAVRVVFAAGSGSGGKIAKASLMAMPWGRLLFT